MKYLDIAGTELSLSNIVMGCMHLNELSVKETAKLIETALEQGINFFDHADIYGGGECETIFAQAVEQMSLAREDMMLQSKSGIVQYPGGAYYDFSKQHIMEAVDGSLRRLKTDYLDILLLHRPDVLAEPDEIAAALDSLYDVGKVRHFGVSNLNPMQVELFQRAFDKKFLFNQLQFSIAHTPMVDTGLTDNMKLPQSVERTGSILEYSRINNMTIQAWSPLQRGFFEGPFLGDTTHYQKLNEVIDRIAAQYGVTNTAVAIGWITRHPANMQVVTGTTKPARLTECCNGSVLSLTKQEWYEIYTAAGNVVP